MGNLSSLPCVVLFRQVALLEHIIMLSFQVGWTAMHLRAALIATSFF